MGLASPPKPRASLNSPGSPAADHGVLPRENLMGRNHVSASSTSREIAARRAAHPREPAPWHLHLHRDRGPQGGPGSTGGTGVHRGDRESTGRPGSPHGGRGSTGGTARTVPVSPATACTPQAHTFPHTLMLTCTHRLTPEPQAVPRYPASSQPWGPKAGAGVGEPGCYLGMEGGEGSSGHVGRQGHGQSVSGRQNQGAT